MTDYVREGRVIPYNGTALSAGDVALVGEKVGVAKHDIALNTDGNIAAEGVFSFPKEATSVTFAAGVKVYWDVADQYITEDADSGTNKLIGYTTESAIITDATVEAYLVNGIA